MADNTSVTFFRGAATTSSVTVYTCPAKMTICVTNIAITNTTAGGVTATLSLGGVALFSGLALAANTTTYLTPDQIIYDGEVIAATASSTSVNFHIAGYEVY